MAKPSYSNPGSGNAGHGNICWQDRIRWMIRRDMPEVMAIEAASYTAPWAEEYFLQTLRQRNAIGMVVDYGDKVVGYMLYELHKNHLEIKNFAVHPEWRHRGVGAAMVAKLASKLSSHRRSRIRLAVSEANLPAQLFFSRCGFQAVRVLRGEEGDHFYGDAEKDAYLMEYRMPTESTEDDDAMDDILSADVSDQPAAGVSATQPANRISQYLDD